jgi:hypothetical protein
VQAKHEEFVLRALRNQTTNQAKYTQFIYIRFLKKKTATAAASKQSLNVNDKHSNVHYDQT